MSSTTALVDSTELDIGGMPPLCRLALPVSGIKLRLTMGRVNPSSPNTVGIRRGDGEAGTSLEGELPPLDSGGAW
jgi:hypothetical protein